jgi:hypothetical protein
LIKKLQKTN